MGNDMMFGNPDWSEVNWSLLNRSSAPKVNTMTEPAEPPEGLPPDTDIDYVATQQVQMEQGEANGTSN